MDSMIVVWEPRYRDKKALIATSKIKPGKDVEFIIERGQYKGHYIVKSEDIPDCKVEKMETKSGYMMNVTCVPLDKLHRVED